MVPGFLQKPGVRGPKSEVQGQGALVGGLVLGFILTSPCPQSLCPRFPTPAK